MRVAPHANVPHLVDPLSPTNTTSNKERTYDRDREIEIEREIER